MEKAIQIRKNIEPYGHKNKQHDIRQTVIQQFKEIKPTAKGRTEPRGGYLETPGLQSRILQLQRNEIVATGRQLTIQWGKVEILTRAKQKNKTQLPEPLNNIEYKTEGEMRGGNINMNNKPHDAILKSLTGGKTYGDVKKEALQ